MVKVMTSIYYSIRYLNKIVLKRVDVLPSTNSKARMFGVGILKSKDSYSFITMSLDKMANVYGIKVKHYILINTLQIKIAKILY